MATIAGLTACGGTAEIAPPAKDIVPASVTAVSTDTLRGSVGGAASAAIAVIVKNAVGEPLDTVPVTFTVATGNGVVANSGIRTNATGTAQTTWTLGTAVGLQTVTATVAALPAITFRAIAAPGSATAMAKVAGDAQTAAVGANVSVAPSVKLTDQFGNPVAGVAVSFAVGTGGGTATPLAVNTGADGVATLGTWKLGTTVGTNSLVATAGSLTTTFSAASTVGAAATLALTPGSIPEQRTGQTVQLSVRVADSFGNVIANPAVTYASSAASIAAVSQTGLITFVGAGTATITATSGVATASVAVSVIGHPAGMTATSRIDLATVPPGNIAFTRSTMLISVPAQQKIIVADGNTAAQLGSITVFGGMSSLVAPTGADGPAIATAPGIPSRLWLINPALLAIVDSIDINDLVTATAMTSDGRRAFALLTSGDLTVIDIPSRNQVARINLGGGVSRLVVAPGDTILYATTIVGVLFRMDIRTNEVRQAPADMPNSDLAVGPDGLFYLLDGGPGIVRVFDPEARTVVRTFGVTAGATTIAVAPDGKQVWTTHNNPLVVTSYTSLGSNFIPSGSFSTGLSIATRVYFNPRGSFAAVGNLGGWVDILR